MNAVQTKPEVATKVDSKETGFQIEKMEMPVAKPLDLSINEGIILENNGVEELTREGQIKMIKDFVVAKAAKMRGLTEVGKIPFQTGKLYFNGNVTSLKFPKVLEDENGNFIESLQQHLNRSKPILEIWLRHSQQNSSITVEEVIALC